MRKLQKSFNGRRMREIRHSKNMRVNDLYQKCHMKYYKFHNFESGRSYPTEDEARQIASALGVPLAELLPVID